MKALPPPGSRVAFYARYSTKNQNYRSIDGQFSLLEDYAVKVQWPEGGRFHDAERSGTTMAHRDGMFALLAAADRGEFEVVLVEDIDRASRDAADMHMLAKTLDELDITLCTVSGGVVTDIELAFKAVQNAEYVKQTKAKALRGMQQVVKSGRICNSKAYGTRRVAKFDPDGKPIRGLREIDPEIAPVIQAIFTKYDAGVSTVDICKALNAEGVPSPSGKNWVSSRLTGSPMLGDGILRNRLYIGEFVWGRKKYRRKKGKIVVSPTPVSDHLVNAQPHLAIIDRDLFERVQARLEARGRGPIHLLKRSEYLFSRKLKCGVCRSQYIVLTKRLGCAGRAQMGICQNSRRVTREHLEETVLQRIKDHLLVPELLESCLAEYRAEAERALSDHHAKTERGQIRMKEVQDRLDNLVNQLGATREASFATQVMVQEIDRLAAEKQRLERESKLKPRILGPALDAKSVVARLEAVLEDLRQALGGDDHEAARARGLIRDLVDEIIISPVPGTGVDNRGAGPVMITVEGRLSAFLDLADVSLDHTIKHGSGTTGVLDDTVLTYRFTFRLPFRDPRLSQVYADLPVLSRLLDRAAAPVTPKAFRRALAEQGVSDALKDQKAIAVRVDKALEYLRDRDMAHCILAGPAGTGWVWNHLDLDDAEWKRRALNRDREDLRPVRWAQAPEARVVVIGPRAEKV